MADAPQEKAPEGGEPVKTAKQLKKEAQKREKMEKFLAKKNKTEETQKTATVLFNACADSVYIIISTKVYDLGMGRRFGKGPWNCNKLKT